MSVIRRMKMHATKTKYVITVNMDSDTILLPTFTFNSLCFI